MMVMNRAIGVTLLVVGIPRIMHGFNASDSVISDVSHIVNGAPTNKTIWLLLGGSSSVALGMAMIFKRTRML